MNRNDFVAASSVLGWALESKQVSVDPTFGIRAKTHKMDGFELWSEEEAAQFERRWPMGKRERPAFDLLNYTGLLRGDVA